MSGQPLTRARRAAAAPAARRAAFTPAARAAALADAERRGDRAAAAACGTTPSTICAWRSRARAQTSPGGGSQSKPAAPPVAHGDPDTLLARAAEERAAERRALTKVNRLVRAGLGPDARALSSVASDAGRRASSLEQAAAHARETSARLATEEARLSEAHVQAFDTLARLFFTACGLGWRREHEALLTALLAAFAEAERGDDGKLRVTIPADEADAAREAIERAIRPRLVAALEEEREATNAGVTSPERETAAGGAADFGATDSGLEDPPPDPPPAQPDPEADGLPGWDELDETWKRRYGLNRSLGIREYAAAQQREENNRRRVVAAPGPSRADRYRFSHPGLGQP